MSKLCFPRTISSKIYFIIANLRKNLFYHVDYETGIAIQFAVNNNDGIQGCPNNSTANDEKRLNPTMNFYKFII